MQAGLHVWEISLPEDCAKVEILIMRPDLTGRNTRRNIDADHPFIKVLCSGPAFNPI